LAGAARASHFCTLLPPRASCWARPRLCPPFKKPYITHVPLSIFIYATVRLLPSSPLQCVGGWFFRCRPGRRAFAYRGWTFLRTFCYTLFSLSSHTGFLGVPLPYGYNSVAFCCCALYASRNAGGFTVCHSFTTLLPCAAGFGLAARCAVRRFIFCIRGGRFPAAVTPLTALFGLPGAALERAYGFLRDVDVWLFWRFQDIGGRFVC